MRLLSLLFACYIVALILVPCHDDFPAGNVLASVLEQPTSDQHHHAEDACSPFCTCTCCTTPVAQQQHHLSLDCHVEQRAMTVDLHNAEPCSRNSSIWQPPKIG